MPGGAEEKAAEIEAALEYEIRIRGGDKHPIARSLAKRLERVRRRKEEADADMLSLLEDRSVSGRRRRRSTRLSVSPTARRDSSLTRA